MGKRFLLCCLIFCCIFLCACNSLKNPFEKQDLSQILQNKPSASVENSSSQKTWEERYVEKAIDLVKEYWKSYYDKENSSTYYLEIKNTRLIVLEETSEEYFLNINYVVEFVLFSDFYQTAPYYSNIERYNNVVFYQDGTSSIVARNPFNEYTMFTYRSNYNDFIKEIVDFKSDYNQVLDLKSFQKQESTTQAEGTVLAQKFLSNKISFTGEFDTGEIILTNDHVEKVLLMHKEDLGYYVQICLNDQGFENIKQATSSDLPKTLLLKADETTVLNGAIYEQLNTPEFIIAGSFDKDYATQLFNLLT